MRFVRVGPPQTSFVDDDDNDDNDDDDNEQQLGSDPDDQVELANRDRALAAEQTGGDILPNIGRKI